jgi:hypothetical protein
LNVVRLSILALLLGACANRGMRAPTDGASGAGGTSDAIADARDGGVDNAPACTGASIDAGERDGAPFCAARFNFEGGQLQGASLDPSFDAFSGLVNSGCRTYCGDGALEVAAAFFQSEAGAGGPGSAGKILVPLDSAGEDLTGKTITVHMLAVPPDPHGSDLKFHLVLLTKNNGSQTVGMPATFGTSQWIAAATAPLTGVTAGDGGAGDGGVRGVNAVYSLSLEFFSFQNYAGTIFVDEVDIQ